MLRVASILALAFAVSINAECYPGSYQIPGENVCVWPSVNQTSYWNAWAVCYYFGGLPFGIHSVFENVYLTSLSGQFFNNQPAFIGAQNMNGTWMYPNGSPLVYQNWAAGEPKSQFGCAQIDGATAQWKSVDCDQQLPYFCWLPYNDPNATVTPPVFNTTGTPAWNTTNFPWQNGTATPYMNTTNFPWQNGTATPYVNTTNLPSNVTSWPSNFTMTPPVNTTSWPINNSTWTTTPFANMTQPPSNWTQSPANWTGTFPAYNMTTPSFSNSSVTFPPWNSTVTPTPSANTTNLPPNGTQMASKSELERLVGKAFLAGMGILH